MQLYATNDLTEDLGDIEEFTAAKFQERDLRGGAWSITMPDSKTTQALLRATWPGVVVWDS